MELRVLHTVATGATWYGRFGYRFGRGAYKITAEQVRKNGAHWAGYCGGDRWWAVWRSD